MVGFGRNTRLGHVTDKTWRLRFMMLVVVMILSRPQSARAQRVACSVTCPANVTVNAEPGKCTRIVNYPAPIVMGSCGIITCTPPSGSTYPVGITTITCSSSAGPTCTFTITVNDVEPPDLTCPTNLSLSAAANVNCLATIPDVLVMVTVTDNCPVMITQDPEAGAVVGAGSHPINVIATDESGNTSSCVIEFTVTGPDRDGDGLADCADGCPDDAQKTAAGACGCGVSDADADANGTPDCNDLPPAGQAAPCGTCAQGAAPATLLCLSLFMWYRSRRRLTR